MVARVDGKKKKNGERRREALKPAAFLSTFSFLFI
jgi:hypothetical protein